MLNVFKILLCVSVISGALAQASTDEFSLDGFSEGLDVKKENIKVPEKKDLKSTMVKVAPVDKEYEKLSVTGSHIKRLDMEGASPVMMIDRDMIEQSGYNSVSDVLRDITASSFGGAREASGSNAAGVSVTGSPGSYIDDSGKWKPDTNNCPSEILLMVGEEMSFVDINIQIILLNFLNLDNLISCLYLSLVIERLKLIHIILVFKQE